MTEELRQRLRDLAASLLIACATFFFACGSCNEEDEEEAVQWDDETGFGDSSGDFEGNSGGTFEGSSGGTLEAEATTGSSGDTISDE